MSEPFDEYIYLINLLELGDIEGLEEAYKIIDDFPTGFDEFIRRRWIINAIDCGTYEAVKWMISKNVELEFRDDEGYTAIISTLERDKQDKYEILQLLIDGGASVNGKGLNDYTPLHFAAIHEDIEAMKLLIKNGADLNIRTNIDDFATPIEEARTLKKNKSVEYLENL